MQPKVIKHFDTLITNSLAPLDSISLNQMKMIKSLDSLNATTLKVSNEDKLLNKFSYDTVFTVAVTLSIFALGIFIDRIIKYCDRKIREKKLQRYFKHYLDKITDRTCEKLADIYRETYLTCDIDAGIPTTSPKILTGDFQRIRNINDMELFNTFSLPEELSTILSNIDFIEKLVDEVDKNHYRIRKASDEIRNPMQNNLNKYFKLLGEYVEHVRVNNPQYVNRDAFRDLVNERILFYYQHLRRTRQIKRVYREIVRRIQIRVVDTNIFRMDPVAREIADLGQQISYDYHYLKRIQMDFRLDYRRFHNHVVECQNNIKVERQKIAWR